MYSRKKIADNVLFNHLNNRQPNIGLTVELNPIKFFDTKFTNINDFYKLDVYWKSIKLPSPWTSKTPKRWKYNQWRYSSKKAFHQNLTKKSMKKKFMKSDYSLCWIDSVIHEFQKRKNHGDELYKCSIFMQVLKL